MAVPTWLYLIIVHKAYIGAWILTELAGIRLVITSGELWFGRRPNCPNCPNGHEGADGSGDPGVECCLAFGTRPDGLMPQPRRAIAS